MKRVLLMILAAVLLLSSFAFTSCDSKKDDDETTTATTTPAATTAEITTVTEAETTTRVVTTMNPNEPQDEDIPSYSEDVAGGGPVMLTSTNKGTGMSFTIPKGYWMNSITVHCPSYSDNFGSLTFYLYKWDTDFDTTVQLSPVQVTKFEDFVDNDFLVFSLEDKKALCGEDDYLFIVKDAIDEAKTDEDGVVHSGGGVGIYTRSKLTDDDFEYFPYYKDFNFQYYSNGKLAKKASKTIIEAVLSVGYIPAEAGR